jgi:hypothetical protein
VPGDAGVQVALYGLVVSVEITVVPERNSTLLTDPGWPPIAISAAVAVIVTLCPGRTAAPFKGDVRLTVGGGLASTLEAPVTTKEKAWVLVVNVPSKDTVTV